MTSTRRSLRVETPVLEPDDVLVARLAASARRSVAPARRRRRLGDWRVSLVTAGLVVVSTGGAYAAGVIGPLNLPDPLDRSPAPTTPKAPTGETEPVPASPTGDGESGAATEPPVGRPTDLPTEGTGGPTDRPTGPPSGVPSGQPSGLPSGHPTGPPSGLPTPDHPTGKPTSPPSGGPTGLPSATPTNKAAGPPSELPTGRASPSRPSPRGGP